MSTHASVVAADRAFGVRNAMICTMFTEDCFSGREIGDVFELSHQRVRQILGKKGLSGEHGGRNKKCKQVRDRRRHELIAAERARYFGMTLQDFKQKHNGGKLLSAKGTFYRAYQVCRRNALNRGVLWTITFMNWAAAWEEAGGWTQGSDRGREPVFGRVDKDGGYTPDNIHVIDRKTLMLGRGGRFAVHW